MKQFHMRRIWEIKAVKDALAAQQQKCNPPYSNLPRYGDTQKIETYRK